MSKPHVANPAIVRSTEEAAARERAAIKRAMELQERGRVAEQPEPEKTPEEKVEFVKELIEESLIGSEGAPAEVPEGDTLTEGLGEN